MTKQALIGMTKAMALELGEKKIRVNAIVPGMVVKTRDSGEQLSQPQEEIRRWTMYC